MIWSYSYTILVKKINSKRWVYVWFWQLNISTIIFLYITYVFSSSRWSYVDCEFTAYTLSMNIISVNITFLIVARSVSSWNYSHNCIIKYANVQIPVVFPRDPNQLQVPTSFNRIILLVIRERVSLLLLSEYEYGRNDVAPMCDCWSVGKILRFTHCKERAFDFLVKKLS